MKAKLILSIAVVGVIMAAQTSLMSFQSAHAATYGDTQAAQLFHRKHVRHVHHYSHKHVQTAMKSPTGNMGAWITPHLTVAEPSSIKTNDAQNTTDASTAAQDTGRPAAGSVTGDTNANNTSHVTPTLDPRGM